VAAVDLLDVKGQPKVFEVNSSPALPEMEAATGMDLATPIIERAEALLAGAPGVEKQELGGELPTGLPGGQGGASRRRATGRTSRKVP
jgi:ribosomal protein S6--L-glutamate ligase